MDKQEIIEALLCAKEVYTEVILQKVETDVAEYVDRLDALNVECGFCLYFDCKYGHERMFAIVDELRYELQLSTLVDMVTFVGYWYPVITEVVRTVANIQQQSLKPRLDHINRTIARLQSELTKATI